MILGLTEQRIVQGQTYCLGLEFDAEDIEKISKLWFSCSALHIVREMQLDSENNVFMLEISWEETKGFEPQKTSFNITAELIGSNKPREIANGVDLNIIKNINPV